MRERLNILGLEIDQVSFKEALRRVMELGFTHTPSYVCFANVHMTVEAWRDSSFAAQVNRADLVLPDGKPLAQAGRLLHKKRLERIAGMDFMPALLKAVDSRNYRVFFYGSDTAVLQALEKKIAATYSSIEIAGAISPPFRRLTESEQLDFIEQINRSSAHIVFVSLGCPKQEKWMYANHHRLHAVLLGVGGAFRVTAGLQKRAPVWMQKKGLEWLYRLRQEPRRLFKRYLTTNAFFLWLLTKEMVKRRIHSNG